MPPTCPPKPNFGGRSPQPTRTRRWRPNTLRKRHGLGVIIASQGWAFQWYQFCRHECPKNPIGGGAVPQWENIKAHSSQTPWDRNTNSTALLHTKDGLSNSTTFALLITLFWGQPDPDPENGHAHWSQTPWDRNKNSTALLHTKGELSNDYYCALNCLLLCQPLN